MLINTREEAVFKISAEQNNRYHAILNPPLRSFTPARRNRLSHPLLFSLSMSHPSSNSFPAKVKFPLTIRPQRQSSTAAIDTAPLLLGSCLAIGTCYYDGNQQGCYTAGCGNHTLLGSICSCNADVQKALDVQLQKGAKQWPVKCPY